MKRLILLVSMALASTAQAGNRADPLHDESMRVSQQFCADAKTTLDYNACSGEELALAQAELSATFAAALAKWQDSQETADALPHAQKAWEVTFEADVAARFAKADAARARGDGVGTAYVSAYNWYEAQLTRARAVQLCEFLRGAAYGERDTPPCDQLVKQVLNEQKK
ncbi:MAG TPA: hypothetical protein DCM36_05835 [Xanthomonadaceae bacterium]|nr:hypothetical protein [Xanthomonadaceae bacterium]